MNDSWYRCIRCGHVGNEAPYDEGQPASPICASCSSYEIEACATPAEGPPVPRQALVSAEAQALFWKKRAEQLGSLIKRGASAGGILPNYATEARLIMAGIIR